MVRKSLDSSDSIATASNSSCKSTCLCCLCIYATFWLSRSPQHECRKTPVDASMRLDRGAMSAEPGLFLQHYVSQGGVSLLFHSYCTYLSFPNGGHPSYRKAMPIFLRRRETHLIDAPHRRVSGAFGPGRPAASFGSFY